MQSSPSDLEQRRVHDEDRDRYVQLREVPPDKSAEHDAAKADGFDDGDQVEDAGVAQRPPMELRDERKCQGKCRCEPERVSENRESPIVAAALRDQ